MSVVADAAAIPASRVPVDVRYPPVEKQRRWTVALRLFLVLPQAVVLIGLAFAATAVAIVGWFSALAIGRLPAGIASFLTKVVAYSTRVSAYGWLLLDAYPPFAFERPYPISVEVEPTRLRRASVLFRLLLAIPAYLIATIVSFGFSLAAFPIWLIVLALGRMPSPLYQASAATIRYQTRYTAYALLLTSAYPRRLFGDREFERGLFGDQEFVLSKAAKSIVALFLVLGIVGWIGGVALAKRARASSGAATRVISDYNESIVALRPVENEMLACSSEKHPTACVQARIPAEIAALDRFGEQLRTIGFPASAQPDAVRLEETIARATGDLHQMATARTTVAFEAAALREVGVGVQVDRLTHRLVADLS
jgi:hypothetical protein